MTAPPLGICCRGRVLRVIDGDTLVFAMWGVLPIHVRLQACWAAELHGGTERSREMGAAAMSRLRTIAEGKAGRLFVYTGDADELKDVITLGRLLGRVWIDPELHSDVSEMMTESGLAFRSKAELTTAATNGPPPP